MMLEWWVTPLAFVVGLGLGGAVILCCSVEVEEGKLIEQRNELVRLSTAVVREHQFAGYAMTPSYSLGEMKRYLEAIKCDAKSAN